MRVTYDADIVGNLVISQGSTSAFCTEGYKRNFTCSVCKQQIKDKVVTVTARREHLLFHLGCADRFTTAIEHALMKMNHDFNKEVVDD